MNKAIAILIVIAILLIALSGIYIRESKWGALPWPAQEYEEPPLQDRTVR